MPSYGNGANCDKLWRAWYVIIIIALNVFLIYIGITRYLSFKNQAFDPKFGGDWDLSGLNFTLGMLISAMASFCLFLFVVSTRTTNYANEGTQIGRDTNNLSLLASHQTNGYQLMNCSQNGAPCNLETPGSENLMKRTDFSQLGMEEDRISHQLGEEAIPLNGFDPWPVNGAPGGYVRTPAGLHLSLKKSMDLLWQRFQRHFLPYTVALQLITAICLLLPIPVLHAQQIFHRALTSDWIWKSDLDLIFGSAPMKSPVSSNADSNVKQEDSGGTTADVAQLSNWENLRAVSPEFFNLALVFLLLTLRYPSVFWYTNKSFSFIFSLLLLLTGIQGLVEYCAASVLVKLFWNRESFPDTLSLHFASASLRSIQNSKMITIDGTEETIVTVTPNMFLKIIGPMILSTVGTLLLVLLHITVFEYGYTQFTENLSAYSHFLSGSTRETCFTLTENGEKKMNSTATGFNVLYDRNDSSQSGIFAKSAMCTGMNSSSTTKKSHYAMGAEILHPFVRIFLYRYAPHIGSLTGLLFVLAFKIPLMWDCFQIYRLSKQTLMLVSPLCVIIALSAWFIAWFAFSLKPAWKFQVNLPLHTLAGMPLSSERLMHPAEINGQMSGSMLRPASLSLYRDGTGRLMANGTASLNLDEGSIHNPMGLPSSPVYACFHDPSNGYMGMTQRLVRLASANGANGACSNGTGILAVQHETEPANEELEASSGRQSRNNYVCLQTALGTVTNGSFTQNIAVPMENGVLVTQVDSAPELTRTVFTSTINPLCSFGQNETGPMILSSPSSPGRNEDDTNSVNTMSLGGLRLNELPNLGIHDALTINRYMSRINSNKHQHQTPLVLAGNSFMTTPFPTGLTTTFTDPALYTACSSNSKDTENAESTITSSTFAPRVTFKENVDVIAQGSSLNSTQHSTNSVPNEDRGILYSKAEGHPVTSTPSESSGTYDNAFSAAFRSSFSTRDHRMLAEPRNLQNSAAVKGLSLSPLPSPFSVSCSNQSVCELSTFAQPLNSKTLQPARPNQMIGDTSFQSSSADPFPHNPDDTSEQGLCSQV